MSMSEEITLACPNCKMKFNVGHLAETYDIEGQLRWISRQWQSVTNELNEIKELLEKRPESVSDRLNQIEELLGKLAKSRRPRGKQ